MPVGLVDDVLAIKTISGTTTWPKESSETTLTPPATGVAEREPVKVARFLAKIRLYSPVGVLSPGAALKLRRFRSFFKTAEYSGARFLR